MSSDGLDISELTNFETDLLKFANDTMPKESKKFLRSTGTKLKKVTISKAKSKIKKGDGDYFKSIKIGKVYKYKDSLAIRCYSGDPKAHLLEKGHRQVTKSGEEVGWVDGYHVFEESEKDFESTYNEVAGKFVDEIIDKINS